MIVGRTMDGGQIIEEGSFVQAANHWLGFLATYRLDLGKVSEEILKELRGKKTMESGKNELSVRTPLPISSLDEVLMKRP